MPIESAADRAALLNPEEAGIAFTYTKQGGGPVEIAGVFDNGTGFEAQHDTEGQQFREAMLLIAESDLPSGAAAGGVDQVSIDGTDYTVETIEPDGAGMVVLRLERA